MERVKGDGQHPPHLVKRRENETQVREPLTDPCQPRDRGLVVEIRCLVSTCVAPILWGDDDQNCTRRAALEMEAALWEGNAQAREGAQLAGPKKGVEPHAEAHTETSPRA